MRVGQTMHVSLACAFLTFGQSLAGPVFGSSSTCWASRLAEKNPCESQAGEKAGDLTLAVTLCKIAI